jgi:hypothetical protein
MADPPAGADISYEVVVPGTKVDPTPFDPASAPLAEFDAELAAMANPSRAEVRAYRQRKIEEARAEAATFANELGRIGATVDDANLKPTFSLRPIKGAPEWEWWYQLTPKKRQSLARRYFTGNADRVDVLASQAGMTADEWGEQFLELADKHTGALAATRPGTSRMAADELRAEMVANNPDIQQLEQYRYEESLRLPKPTGANVTGPTPPPKKGMVRVYRGQHVEGTQMAGEGGQLPSWLADNPEVQANFAARRSVQGRWYTDDPNLAARYPANLEPTEQAEVVYVDIPKEEFDRIRGLQDQDVGVVSQSLSPHAELILPEKYVGQQQAFVPGFVKQQRKRRYGRTKASMAFAEQSQLYQQLQRDVVMWQNRVKEVAAGGPQLQTAAYLAQQNLDLAAQQYDAVLASRNGWANNWNDVHERMVDTAYGHLLNAYNQNREMYSAMSIDRLQPFKEGQAIVWEVPRPAPGMTYEQVLVAATDRSVIAANEQLVRKWLKQDWARATDEMGPGIGAVADKQLADQLFTVVRPGGHLPQQTARGYRADGAVLQGRAMPGFVPIHAAEADKPLLWRLDESIHTQWENFDRAGGLTEKVRKQAEQMVGRMRQIGTKESRQVLRAQGRVGEIKEEGAIYPRVYRRLQSGELEPVAPGTIVRDNETYVDMKNRPIRPGHPMYFAEDVLDAETQGDVMWALVGPMYEDMADQLQQVERWAPAHRYTLRDEGRVKPSTDRVRVYRSDRSHVNNVDFGLPRYVTAPTIRDVDGNMWDRIVRYGFDRIIGPSIDSLARKPMAFHFFAERYSYSKRVAGQFRSQQIMEEMEGVLSKVGAASNPDLDVDSVAAASRRLAAFTTSDNTTQWSDQMALGWLRGHDEKELTTMLDGVLARTKVRVTPEARQAYVDAFKLKNRDPAKVLSTFKSSGNADEFMAYARSIMGERIADPVFWSTFDGQQLISQNEILNSLDQADWDTIAKSEREIARIRREAGEYAATAAINDMIPFIDSHELRTQMAEFAKPLMPFWYAEENFLKRWVRTALDQGPVSTVRKAQLAYAGLKSGGIIRTDENGVDYFVYPGSSLLIEAVAKVWPGAELPVGALFQTRTDAILPGMSAARIGQPAFSPMLSVPMNLISQRVPELAPVQRAMFGDFSASTSALSQFVPNSLQRFFEAFTASGEASARYASAQMSAIAMMEASGKGLPDNATAGDQDEYLRKVNEHARIILVSQALMGFFVPGPPQQVVAGEDSITGLGIEDPRNVLSTLYQDMISTFGIEQGTIEFLETYPMANLHNIAAVTADGSAPVLGLVEGRSDSRSGAPLPPTTTAMDFYAINKNYMQEMPFAGPWLLPTSDGSARDQYAYDQQVINGLRQQSTPEEFLRSIKFKEAAGPYFEARTAYLDRIAALEVAKASPEEIAAAKDAWDTYSTVWKVTHPIFKEELESSEGRTRRARTIAEMQRVINDPAAPKPAHFQAMQETMQSYNNYKTQLTIMSQDRSAKGEAKVERLKRDYSAFMDEKSRTNSTVRAFWTSVLRPEASLD